jgi:hypothetical protein
MRFKYSTTGPNQNEFDSLSRSKSPRNGATERLSLVMDLEQVLLKGDQEARQSGLGAMDALHVAAAVLAGETELITTEKPDKSIYRTRSIQVISIYSL